jgi:type I restriction enzyme M protein
MFEQDCRNIDQLRFRSQTEKHELSHLNEPRIKNMGNAGRNGGEEFLHCSPEEIMEEIVALDAETAEVLGKIRSLL